MSALLSIIIPSYNSGHELHSLLISIQNQSFRDFEVIVVDGDSTDSTKQIVQEFESDISIFISEKDRGIYDAMNKGIEASSGKWLYFIGCDDRFYSEDSLKEIFHVDRNEFDLIYAKIFNEYKAKIEGEAILEKSDLLTKSIWHQSVFYKRELFDRYGSYDLRYKIAADVVFNLSVFSSGELKTKFLDTVVASFSGEGISSYKIDSAYHEDQEKLYEKWFGDLPKKTLYNGLQYHMYNEIKTGSVRKAFSEFMVIVKQTGKINPYLRNALYYLRKRLFS